MSQQKPLFIVVDGNALLHRAWHAIPPLTTKDGRVVNAAYGFAMVMEKLLDQYKPTFMAVAWDLPGKTFRHEKFESYKAQREEKEPELYMQIPIIQEMLKLYGVESLSVEGYEADDVIGTLAQKAEHAQAKTFIVTGDLDSLQLVSDDTHVLFFQKGISETKTYDHAAVQERYGFGPERLIDYKALRGDPSDNIPGVPGIGEKTATELIQAHGSIEGIFAALKKGAIPEKYAKKLQGQEQTAKDALFLVTIVRTVPLPVRFPSLKVGKRDIEKLTSLFRDLEFRTLLRKYAGVESEEEPKAKKGEKQVWELVRGTANLKKALASLSSESIGIVAAQQAADLFGSTLAAVALSDGKKTFVVPNPTAENVIVINQALSDASHVVMHDAKALMHALTTSCDDRCFDLMIASYLLNSASRAHDIPSIIFSELKRKLSDIPTAFATEKEYGILAEAVQTFPELAQRLQKQLEKEGTIKAFREIDMPLIPVLFDMERAGIALDTNALEAFSKRLKKDITRLEKAIIKHAGETFNVNSPSQLAVILFEKLGLPTKGIKKTQSGFSTAAPELEKIIDAHPIVPLIGEYRELTKLQSTYVEALPQLVAKDGRIHTTFNQTIAATGRLSSINPNLQNIPIKTDLGNEVRKAFVAESGKKLISLDYSQIELRLAAVIAKDEPFIRAFKEGADIHTRTAAEVWGIEESAVTSEQRRAAKAINFGILYGMGSRSLARSTGMSNSEAQQFIERYFDIHFAIRNYLDETKAMAHTRGYVETLFGRRRYLPEIKSGVQMLVASAERMAINMPVQGTAADIMKLAMMSAHGWITHSGWPAKLLLQVHDELVIEADAGAVDAVIRGVKQMMEEVVSYPVPLAVNAEVGDSWGEMEEWKE